MAEPDVAGASERPSVIARMRVASRWFAIAVLVVIQAFFGWIFVMEWSWHLHNILEFPSAFALLWRAGTAVIFLGVVAAELVLLVRRRFEPLPVVAGATAAVFIAVLLEYSWTF